MPSLEKIIAPYTTGNKSVSISLPAEFYISGDSSIVYSEMTSDNGTFSTESKKTVLFKIGINKKIDVVIDDEDLIITLSNNGLNKILDISSTSIVIKTGVWVVSSDNDLTTSLLKSIFEESYTALKVEIREDATNGWILVVSEISQG